MPLVTILVALFLIILGVGSWLEAGQSSVTALIPAFFGLPLLLAGVIARKDTLRKHAMHAAAAIALLGALGALGRGVPAALADDSLRLATIVQLTMGITLVVFIVLCVRSFIAARKAGGLDSAST
ncbi:MAG: hypothetical protein AAGA84_06520 [Pseudomonadota bacterium]